MRRRLTILICTIISVCLTLATVTYTIIKTGADKNAIIEGGSITEIGQNGEGQSEQANVVSVSIRLVVGETTDNAILMENKEQVSEKQDLLVFDTNYNAFVAQNIGSTVIDVLTNGNVVYKFSIFVFSAGDGSEENPYNITNPNRLIELLSDSSNNNVSVYYRQQNDFDLSQYESWKPIGDLSGAFLANYDGNGFSINNMKIVITQSNLRDYVVSRQTTSGVYAYGLTVGFFGRAGDSNNHITLSRLNFSNAVIDTTAVDGVDYLQVSYIGILAGQVRYANVTGQNVDGSYSNVEGSISSSLTNNNINRPEGAIAGLIGCAECSNVSGFVATSTIEGNNPALNNSGTKYGARYAGLVGLVDRSTVSNCNVEFNFEGKNYVYSRISGAFYYLNHSSSVSIASAQIQNVNVKEFVAKVSRFTSDTTTAARVSGFVDTLNNSNSVINNCSVRGLSINGVGAVQGAGFVSLNYGKINDCTVAGKINASMAAGFVYMNEGPITYTENVNISDNYVVNVDMYGQTQIGGFALHNHNVIKGASAQNKTQIKAALRWSVVDTYFLTSGENLDNKYMMAGVAVYSAGTSSSISNLYTIVNIYDAVNATGGIGYFGVDGSNYGGTFSDCSINTTVRSIKGVVGTTNYTGKTNAICGAVCFVPATSSSNAKTINNVDVCITVNNRDKIDATQKYGVNLFGGIAAKIDSKVSVNASSGKSSTLYVNFYSNYCASTLKYGNLVGTISGNASSSNVVVKNIVMGGQSAFDVSKKTVGNYCASSTITFAPTNISGTVK